MANSRRLYNFTTIQRVIEKATDGADVTIPVTVSISDCQGFNDVTPNPVLSRPVRLDNVRPEATISFEASPKGAIIGQPVWFNFTSKVDVATAVADLRHIGHSQTATLNANTPNQFTVQATTSSDPIVVDLADAAGNSQQVPVPIPPSMTLDTVAPVALQGFQAVPKPGGIVEVSFQKSADTDLPPLDKGYFVRVDWPSAPPRYFQVNNSTGALNLSTGFVGYDKDQNRLIYNLAADNFNLGQIYSFTGFARDVAGNDGAPTPTTSLVPSNSPTSVVFTSIPSPTHGRDWFPVEGEWYSSTSVPSDNQQLRLWIRNSAGDYWNGNDPNVTANFGSKQTFGVLNTVGDGQGFRGTFASTLISDASQAGSVGRHALFLPADTYTIGMDFASQSFSFTFIFDRAVPALDNSRSMYNKPSPDPTSGIAQGDPLRFNFAYQDAGTGVKTVQFAIQQTTTGNPPAVDVNNKDAIWVCTVSPSADVVPCSGPGAAELTLEPSLPRTSAGGIRQFKANLTLQTPKIPLVSGNYRLFVTYADAAGNAGSQVPTQTLKVHPRLAVNQTELAPFADANGIYIEAYASYDGKKLLHDPVISCPQDVCRVTDVEIHYRNVSNHDQKGVSHVSVPISEVPRTYPHATGSTQPFYNYTPSGRISIPDTMHPSLLEVKARAVVRLGTDGNSPTVVAETAWIRVKTVAAPGGLLLENLTEGSAWMSSPARNQTVWLNATFEKAGLTGVPVMHYRFKVLEDRATPANVGKYVRLDGASVTYGTDGAFRQFNATRLANGNLPAADKFWFNWTNNATGIPAGRYQFEMELRDPASPGAPPLATATRTFSVETNAPVVVTSVPQPEMFPPGVDARFVTRSFNFVFRVDHGYAPVTADGVQFALDAPNKDPGSTGDHRVENGIGGFEVVFRSAVLSDDKASTTFTYGVTLPTNSTQQDGNRYYLRVNATSVAKTWTPGERFGAAVRSVIIDIKEPSAVVLRAETNATGANLTGGLKFIGVSEDMGSGTAVVEVRVYDVTNNTTFVPNVGVYGGEFHSGLKDAWLSSQLMAVGNVGHVVNVKLEDLGNGQTVWHVPSGSREKLNADGSSTGQFFGGILWDRNHTYQVDVRVRDHLNPMKKYGPFEVRFDEVRPSVVKKLSAGGDAADLNVEWQGSGYVNVTVKDNNCVKRVSLVVNSTNRTGGLVDFPRPAGLGCWYDPAEWSLDLSKAPGATNDTGRVEWGIEVEDAAGNVFRDGRTINVTVHDATRAEVRFLYLEPPVVGVGGRSRVVAEIFENSAIDQVRVFFAKLLPDGTTQEIAEGLARPLDAAANGTGLWVAETDTDLNLTSLELGDYLWTVRPMDANWTKTCNPGCHQLHVIVRVTDDAAPFVRLDAPAATAEWVNASPTFRFTAIGGALDADGFELLVGNSTENLTQVTPTNLTETFSSGGNSTGFVVTYRAQGLEDGNVSVRLKVVSTRGQSNESQVYTFRVDPELPTVSANVTGVTTLDGEEYAASATRVALEAADNASGIAGIAYSVNGGAPQAYSAPITPSGADGAWRLDYVATDRAGNAANGTLTLRLDKTGPSVTVNKHGDELLVTVTDAGVGVDEGNITAHYAYGSGATFSVAEFEKVTGNSYRALLPGNASETGLRYYVEAKDRLGNVGSFRSASQPYVIEPDAAPQDLKPTVRITAPQAGATLPPGPVQLRWLAEDPEGATLSVTIALREPVGQGVILSTGGENNGTWTVDLSGAADGAYSLIVTASDGVNSEQVTVAFAIEAGDVVEVATPPPANATPNQAVQFSVKVNAGGKTVSSVTYNVTRDGAPVSGGLLQQQGTNWSGTIVPTQAGNYRVFVAVTYGDGTTEPAAEVASFTVAAVAPPPGGGGAALPPSFLTLVVLALATIALAAYAGFVRWGR